jgi:hypothetical protein
MIVYEQRASTILYNILKTGSHKKFLIPANICPIVIAVFLKSGVNFELVDICNESYTIDPAIVKDKLRNDPSVYSGLLFVRTYGVNDDFNPFFRELRALNENLLIIDDRCIGEPEFDEEPVVADVNLYSTGYSKFADLGWGAFANIKSNVPYERSRLKYEPGDLEHLNHAFSRSIKTGAPFNFDCIASHWLDTEVPLLSFHEYKKTVNAEKDKSRELKKKFNDKFSKELPGSIQMPAKFQGWRFNILVPGKEELLKKIFDHQLFASSHFMPASRIFYNTLSPNADALEDKILNLFSDRYFPFEKTDDLIGIINTHLESYS